MHKILLGFALTVCAAIAVPVGAQEKINLSIATGGTGGVYYPLGGGMANLLSKYVPGIILMQKLRHAALQAAPG
jgi:TRAP-type uncharacterized transport system substrate-binding protein